MCRVECCTNLVSFFLVGLLPDMQKNGSLEHSRCLFKMGKLNRSTVVHSVNKDAPKSTPLSESKVSYFNKLKETWYVLQLCVLDCFSHFESKLFLLCLAKFQRLFNTLLTCSVITFCVSNFVPFINTLHINGNSLLCMSHFETVQSYQSQSVQWCINLERLYLSKPRLTWVNFVLPMFKF
jgi:hypothetical protein